MDLLVDVTIIFAVSVVAVLVCHRMNIPSTVGFLLAGILAGPHGLGLVRMSEQVELLAEVGIVLLMFMIGLEFSLSGLAEIRRPFLLGGSVQMLGTAAVVGLGTYILGSTIAQSVYLGLVVSLSSTAVVLDLLQKRAELDSPHGRTVLGALIFQDIAVVPIMLAAPLLAGTAGASPLGGLAEVGFGVAAVGIASYVAYRWVVPWLLHRIAMTGSREAFLLGVLVICIAIALLTREAGLSLALGAFLAGLIISESEYSYQAVSVILPFRDAFMSLFFVSIGMLLDVQYLLANPLRIALLTLGIVAIKPLVASFSALLVGLPMRNAVLAGVSLGQIGEFSLVLAAAGVAAGLFGTDVFQTVLDTAVASMILAPALVAAGPWLADSMARMPLPARVREGVGMSRIGAAHSYDGHVLIIGFGVTGRNVARAAEDAEVPYAAVEINAEVVRSAVAEGHHIHFGDATSEAILRHVNAELAKAIVVVINDPAAARRITELARRVSPDAYLVVRSRYLRETEALHALGADEVIADELEISIEIFTRVLARFLVPHEDIERFARESREEWRDMARTLAPAGAAVHDLRVEVPDLTTRSFRVGESSPLAGRTIAQSGLRPDHGVSVLAVKRGRETIGNPRGSFVLDRGDVLFVFGPNEWDPATVA
jgi:CPA2 family monovalent cation:H+ antiporter-2